MLFDWTSLVLSIVLATIYSAEGLFFGRMTNRGKKFNESKKKKVRNYTWDINNRKCEKGSEIFVGR